MDIRKVLIVGSGTLGQQIGFQCAMHGFETTMYDLHQSSVDACRDNHRQYAELFTSQLGKSKAEAEAALARISYTTDLAAAGRDADLVSESVPEHPEIKKQVYASLHKHCPAKTIFTTNTSTLLPSQFAEATGRPSRFCALHFANEIWLRNIGEVMGHPGTDPEIYEIVVKFAKAIGMVPIRLTTEQNGYVINSLLVPWLTASQALVANGVAKPEDVDKTWMIATKMALGPFGFLDMIGLETAYNVFAHWGEVKGDEQLKKNAAYVKTHFLDNSKLGVKTGEGYYTHPNPAYAQEGFLDSLLRNDPQRTHARDIKKVLIVGSGTLGQQIGFQCAMHGFDTTMYDLRRESLDACRASHRQYADMFASQRGKSKAEVDAALARISYTTDLAEAGRDADIVSESVPENPDIKRQVYPLLNKHCPAKTIFTTNTSTLLPSQFADATGRPARFCALHFANEIWDRNVGEVMGHPGTDPEIYERVVEFAKAIGMVPIRLTTEQNGYVLNTMLVAWLLAAQSLVTNGVARPEDVDRTWMITTKMPIGPFGIWDMVGLETAHHIASYWGEVKGDEQLKKNAEYFKKHFVDKNKLGVKTGEGYYKHPNPAYAQPDFLA